MNENYNNCVCECVTPKDPTIQDLERLSRLNEQLSAIYATLYGNSCGDSQNLEVKCLNDPLVSLLDKANAANEKACRIIDGLS